MTTAIQQTDGYSILPYHNSKRIIWMQTDIKCSDGQSKRNFVQLRAQGGKLFIYHTSFAGICRFRNDPERKPFFIEAGIFHTMAEDHKSDNSDSNNACSMVHDGKGYLPNSYNIQAYLEHAYIFNLGLPSINEAKLNGKFFWFTDDFNVFNKKELETVKYLSNDNHKSTRIIRYYDDLDVDSSEFKMLKESGIIIANVTITSTRQLDNSELLKIMSQFICNRVEINGQTVLHSFCELMGIFLIDNYAPDRVIKLYSMLIPGPCKNVYELYKKGYLKRPTIS